jgi:hypothetical protein
MPRTAAGILPPGFESARGKHLDPEAQRRDGLEKLARTWSDTAEVVREAALAWMVHPSLTGQALAEAWHDYMAALSAADDFRAGLADWRDYSSWEVARDALRGQVAAAMSQLINGAREAGTQ